MAEQAIPEDEEDPRLRALGEPRLDVPLPLRLPVLATADGRTVIQYGDPGQLHDRRTNLYWYDRDKEVPPSVENQFENGALLALSSDGYLAVVGTPLRAQSAVTREQSERQVLAFFNPSGRPYGVRQFVDASRHAVSLHVARGGERVVLITISRVLGESGFNIEERSPVGRESLVLHASGLPQRSYLLQMAGSDEESLLLVQGRDSLQLIELGEGRVRWVLDERLRLLSSNAATATFLASPDGEKQVLILLHGVGDCRRVRWVLEARDLLTGQYVGSMDLGQWFEGVDEGQVESVELIGSLKYQVLVRDRNLQFPIDIEVESGTAPEARKDILLVPDDATTEKTSAESASLRWPVESGIMNILHGFGTPYLTDPRRPGGNSGLEFHPGIDILAPFGRVVAVQAGKVRSWEPTEDGGTIRIESTSHPRGTYWYLHVDLCEVASLLHEEVEPGDLLGVVNDGFFRRKGREFGHLHLASNRNPLELYETLDLRDPHGMPPRVGKLLRVVDAQDHRVLPEKSTSPGALYATGEVDLLIETWDEMDSHEELRVAPHSIGYWIESLVPGGKDVASALDPYQLVRFNTLDDDLDDDQLQFAIHREDCQRRGKRGEWPTCLTWIVTHTKGFDGAFKNVSRDAFWKTDAREFTISAPNGTGTQDPDAGTKVLDSRDNQEAHFPDGKYCVHVLVEDLSHIVRENWVVVIDNHRPYVRRVEAHSEERLVYSADWRWEESVVCAEGRGLLLSPPSNRRRPNRWNPDVTMALKVRFSEPMEEASVRFGKTGEEFVLHPGPHGIFWTVDVPPDKNRSGDLQFQGMDLAGNPLLDLPTNPERYCEGSRHSLQSQLLEGEEVRDTVHRLLN